MNKLLNFSKKYPESGIHSIKLRDILNLRGIDNVDKEIRTMFPPTNIGSITLVDQILLLALTEIISPNTILEIGTFQGFTSRLLLMNTTDCKVITIDLPIEETNVLQSDFDQEKILKDGNYNDDFLREKQYSTGEIYLLDLSENQQQRVKLIKSDSTKLNFTEQVGTVQLSFIDGGHRKDIVSSDTSNVSKITKNGVIIWHDYSSNIHSDVTEFLEEYSKQNQVFHVNGSLCAFSVV